MFLRCQVLDRCFKIFIPYRHLFHGRNYSLWLGSNNFKIMLVCYSRWMQRLGKANTKVLIKFGLKQCSLMHHLFDRPENGENYVLSHFFLSDLALASSATLHIYSRNKDLNGIGLWKIEWDLPPVAWCSRIISVSYFGLWCHVRWGVNLGKIS